MSLLYNTQLRINKVHTSKLKGYKLGSTNATWKKIKQATNVADDSNGTEEEPIVEQGSLGEVLMFYPISRLVEIWYWIPPTFSDHSIPKDFSGDTLYFYGQIKLDLPDVDSYISSVKIVQGNLNELFTTVIVYRSEESKQFKLCVYELRLNHSYGYLTQQLVLPGVFNSETVEPLVVKLDSKFIVVGNSAGFLYVFVWNGSKYVSANTNERLSNLKKSTCLPILRSFDLVSEIRDNELLLKTSCSNGKPIFDLNNNWLVYSPCKAEYNQIKINQDNITPVKLPTSKPLLNKVLENLSNNALDLLFKISKYSTKKINEYLKNRDQDITMKSIGGSLSKILNQTIQTISDTKAQFQVNDNQIVKIVDLENDKILTVFKTPDGVSNLSFNPYDLQLVNANLRGDSIFIWDMIKLPQEVSLMGKFSRGKTSGVIDEFCWFINNNEADKDTVDHNLKGSNSGFGCINSKTGTVHWYNINYLLSNISNNFPNYLGKEFPLNFENYHTDGFLNSWILSSNSKKYVKFLKLPDLVNFSERNLTQLNQLAVLDSDYNLKLLNPLNGSNCFRFELPTSIVDPDEVETIRKKKIVTSSVSPISKNTMPLSQIEIETCKPFMHLANFKNVEILSFDFDNEGLSDFDAFYQRYAKLQNNELPTKNIILEVSQEADESDDFIEQLVDDLTICQ